MDEVLNEVKKRLQITGVYMDSMLDGWIRSAVSYLKNGGADLSSIDEDAYGVITKGVFDMWTRDSFSPMFLNMATQFCLAHRSQSVDVESGYTIATELDIKDLF